MFGIGGSEFLIIAVIVVMLFGPDKLPKLARTIGRFMSEFKRYQAMMESTLRAEMYLTEEPIDRFKKAGEHQDKLRAEREAAAAAETGDAAEAGDAAETGDASAEPADSTEPVEPAEDAAVDAPVEDASVTVIDGIAYDDEGDAIIAPEDAGWVPGAPDAPTVETAGKTGEEAEERP